jgi:hypothetical protein
MFQIFFVSLGCGWVGRKPLIAAGIRFTGSHDKKKLKIIGEKLACFKYFTYISTVIER